LGFPKPGSEIKNGYLATEGTESTEINIKKYKNIQEFKIKVPEWTNFYPFFYSLPL
jgi:hypothetical protein